MLNYQLTQKLAENAAALEIIKEANDNGLEAWRLLNQEYTRVTGADLLSRHDALTKTHAPTHLRDLPSLLRRWEEEMILLRSEGGDAYVVPDSLKLTILVHRLVGNRTEATLLFQELCNNKERYDTYSKAKVRVLGFVRETVPKTSTAQSGMTKF